MSALAFDLPERFRDPQDGAFDASQWLLDRKGFLPVPIVITEPAVGYGAGLAALFFRESLGERAAQAAATGRYTPPDIYGIAGFGTENGTRGYGGGGLVTFFDDRVRWRGGVAEIDANLDFYGVGGRLGQQIDKVGYNLRGLASVQQAMWRLGETDWWLVGSWRWFDFESRFDFGSDVTLLDRAALAQRSSGLGVAAEFDSRDNLFTPSRGAKGSLEAVAYDTAWGSSTRFQYYRAHLYRYQELTREVVLGLRGDLRAANGDVPFYQLPLIELRGVPLARYQDRRTAVAETELRWNVDARWAVVGFVGAGRAWGIRESFGETSTAVAQGVGFRYLIARRLGIYVGVDVAHGPEGGAWYIQVGSAWR